MNLGKNINSLLKRYTEVYVPGIGVFKRIHSPAQFDKQNNVFLPPISYVELDYSAQHGFNMVHYIQQQGSLGLGQAQQILDEAVRSLRADLEQFGQVKLDDLGLLISYGASLVFKPLDLSGFDFQPVTNLVAPEIETVVSTLEEVHTEEVEQDKEEEVTVPLTEEPHENSPIQEEDVAGEPASALDPAEIPTVLADVNPENGGPIETTDEPEASTIDPGQAEESKLSHMVSGVDMDKATPIESETVLNKEVGAIASANSTYEPNVYVEEPRNSNAIWYWMTGIVILAMVAVGVIYTNPNLKDSLFGSSKPVVNNGNTMVQNKQIAPADSLSNTLVADSLKKTDSLAKVKVTDSVKSATPPTAAQSTTTNAPVLEANPVIKESIPVAQPKYQLVIGSAKTMAQAEQEAKRLREMGYKTARAAEGKSKRKRVILNSYMTKEEADLAQKSVAKKIKDAWVEKL